MRATPFYSRETEGIRVTVRPVFLAEQSRPTEGRYVFAYFVRIENRGDRAAQLLTRRWFIHDSIGEQLEVEGEGVVGEQPHIAPGHAHEYNSFCILKSPRGHMEGQYHFVRPDGAKFAAEIPRFTLDATAAPGPLH